MYCPNCDMFIIPEVDLYLLEKTTYEIKKTSYGSYYVCGQGAVQNVEIHCKRCQAIISMDKFGEEFGDLN